MVTVGGTIYRLYSEECAGLIAP
ncbi:MAG: hypothetical protein QOF36_1538, partial [Microbacteriaceae bacterium]|nr:hypothetical protein [Microbacteriaceae bacterium]